MLYKSKLNYFKNAQNKIITYSKEFMKIISSRIIIAWQLLYYMYGFLFLIAGIDKFFNYLVDWSIYLNDHVAAFLNMTPKALLHVFGALEIIVGLLIFIKPKIGGYLAMLLLLGITLNLVSMGSHSHEGYQAVMIHYDVALHDIALAVGAFAFVLLTEQLGK